MRSLCLWVAGCLIAASALAEAADRDGLSPAANADYLANNAKRPGVVTLPGLQYEILKTGDGVAPKRSDCVTVRYTGTLIDGTVVDRTDKPISLPALMLIPGWTVALQKMHEGDVWRLSVPADMAYGRDGAGGVVPPDQTLIFELELVKVSRPVHGRCS